MTINKLLSKPYLFRPITTLGIKKFDTLSQKLEPEWRERELCRLMERKDRKNKVGQGRKYGLGDFSNLLLATIVYLRTNIGFELIGLLFDVDQSTVKRTVKRIVPLLQDRFIPKTELSKHKRRTNNLDELLKDYPELKDVIFDGSEMPIKRPQKRQKQPYSGKKKRHTKKFQLGVDKSNKPILALSPPQKGKIHDKKQLESTPWNDKLPDGINRWGDLGYIGMPGWIIPHKKPQGKELTKKQKR